jgi:hypothetical protein
MENHQRMNLMAEKQNHKHYQNMCSKSIIFIALLSLLTIQTHAQMDQAYKLANEMVREKLHRESGENIRILDDLKKNDVIVVNGTYDHIHMVLESLKIPFASIDHHQLMDAILEPHQTVFVNCASSFPPEAARKLATFVASGGQLITTDWALRNVIEVAFPNTIAFNDKPTADEVVRIEVIDREDSVVVGFLDEKADPVWWLEGSSYPIKILNKEKVKVLIRSKELKEKYGEEAVVVRFEHEQGTVYHMISHFYLQRTETRDKKQSLAASEYFKDKGASNEVVTKAATTTVTYGEIQSANTSADFVSRIIIKQKRKSVKK